MRLSTTSTFYAGEATINSYNFLKDLYGLPYCILYGAIYIANCFLYFSHNILFYLWLCQICKSSFSVNYINTFVTTRTIFINACFTTWILDSYHPIRFLNRTMFSDVFDTFAWLLNNFKM